ncbi:hypothetical protein G5714_003864 [Onychostoma macrolepis]|uniref:CWH43-like N-terminal domain-containing protein n=1 Tax=Onychostoma macrolepis TaxID=369639 RepID=A0A7J6DBI3_9TELE|nr:hypothetical protein G5714_003864 [Onychostoma macrolepis]
MWAWALLPITLAVFGTIGMWAVYAIAVSNNTVNITQEFPFISTCGSYNPQSCLFSQICNICCVLALWIVTIRFQQVRDLGSGSHLNMAGLVLGFISSIGISILGNFQQSVVKGVHLLGALLAFFLGLVYFWIQAWLSYYSPPSHDRKWVVPGRIILCSLCTCLVICMYVLYKTGFRSEAAICEWALVMCFFALFAIFAAEFRHIDCHKLTVQNKERISTSNATGTQTLLNMLQEITGRDKSTPTANSHTPSKLSSYCSPNTQEASMLCYCWMTRRQVRERNQVEKESGIWEARERNQIGSGICFCYLQPNPDSDQLFVIEPEP